MASGRHRKPTRRALTRSGKHRRPSRVAPRAAALVTVPAVLCGGTAAWAFWSATGTGSATVSTTSAAPLTVTAGATAPDALYPGRTVSLPVTVANSNGYTVSLTKLTAVTPASSDATACPASNIAVNQTVVDAMATGGYTLPTAITVSAGSSTQASLANLITLKSTAPDGCQGRTFTISLSFTGAQV